MVITICIINLKVVQSKNGTVGVFELYRRYESCPDSLLISCRIDRPLNAKWFPAQRLPSDQLAIN